VAEGDSEWRGEVPRCGDAANIDVHDLALTSVDADPEAKAASLCSVADAEGSISSQ
jgi:hypothetical protein